jgi:hypothetical protein
MIPGLDGIRAIAFLLVFSLHTDYIYIGWVGVQLFFVLSGFLITNILLRMKDSLSAGDYFKKFYGRRFLLIFLTPKKYLKNYSSPPSLQARCFVWQYPSFINIPMLHSCIPIIPW